MTMGNIFAWALVFAGIAILAIPMHFAVQASTNHIVLTQEQALWGSIMVIVAEATAFAGIFHPSFK